MIEKSSKSHSNNFKFVLYQGEEIATEHEGVDTQPVVIWQMINERMFSADLFNPVVRYSVDIRDIIPSIISRLQKVLSKKNLNTKDFNYDFLEYYSNQTLLEKKDESDKLSNNAIVKQNANGKTVKVIECKFGLYINDKTIVERKFYVNSFNSSARFSTDVAYVVADICDEIFESLKRNDVNNMWNDYTLINTFGLYVNQIRELTTEKRVELLSNVDDRMFVKKNRSYYKSLQPQHQQSPQVTTQSL